MGILTAAYLAFAGCGGGDDTETRQSTTRGGTSTTKLALPKIEEPPPTAKRLIGTWSRTGSSTLFRFSADGTFAVDTHKLDFPYYTTGTYELDGPTLVFTATGNRCADTWEWQTRIVTAEDRLDDELHIVSRAAVATSRRARNGRSRGSPRRELDTSRTRVARA
jgi:hypothetical protein